jgi:hypothetical protein
MIASAMKYMASSGPSCLRWFTAKITKREFVFVYPFLGSIWSMLGENKWCGLFVLSTKGNPLTAQKPVQFCSAHSKSISQGSVFSFARPRAEITSLRQGEAQYRSLARSANTRYCSGWASRHFLDLARQVSGSASYLAFLSAFRFARSLRSVQICWALCQSAAHFCRQNFVCLPARALPHFKHSFWGVISITFLCTQNYSKARSF